MAIPAAGASLVGPPDHDRRQWQPNLPSQFFAIIDSERAAPMPLANEWWAIASSL
jgi:hypothetical protein